MPLNKIAPVLKPTIQQISRASEVLERKMQQPSYSELAHEACKCPLVYYICMYTVYTQKHNKFQNRIKEVTAKRFSKNVMSI